MFAEDMVRLAEEISGAYEDRVRRITEIRKETNETLASFRTDRERSNRNRSEDVQAELKEMRDTVKSDLNSYRSGLAQFKADLDEAESARKADAQAEVSQRAERIRNLRKDTLNMIKDFEDGRQEVWQNLKADLDDFTSAIAGFRADLAAAHVERVENIRGELKEMGDRLRSDLKGFVSMLGQFKSDLSKSEHTRRKDAVAEAAERRRDVNAVLGGTRDLLKEFNAFRQEMWDILHTQLDAFSSELSKFKADLEQGEKARKDQSGVDISRRRQEIAALNTQGLLKELSVSRQEMWRKLKAELEDFTSELSRFKADLDAAEKERKETVGQDLKGRSAELRSTLSGFTSDLSASVGEMLGQLRRDRTEAARAWEQIVSVMRSSKGVKGFSAAEEVKPAKVSPSEPVDVREEVAEAAPEEVSEESNIQAEHAAAPEARPAVEPEPEIETDAGPLAEPGPEAESEEMLEEVLDEREGLISEILGLLEETPDGLRMVEIADVLGLENWRSLIPVMRELLEGGDVKKEDSTYFIV